MNIKYLGIDGAWLVNSPILEDQRGYFREWFKLPEITSISAEKFSIEQANISYSHKNVLRGIHFSSAPKGQAKWITCVSGAIRDVVVDIRLNSPTFGKHIKVDLHANSGNAIFIGANLGHAFLSLTDETAVAYLLSSPYSPSHEFEINALDPELNIDWGISSDLMNLSSKDAAAPSLADMMIQERLPKI
jgi:dTDP-4-dehydrorhamnose 3,5-epimerase